MNTQNEREIALKTGGKYALLKDYMDALRIKSMPMNETQTMTGLSASDGRVIPSSIIPANSNIPDNLKRHFLRSKNFKTEIEAQNFLQDIKNKNKIIKTYEKFISKMVK